MAPIQLLGASKDQNGSLDNHKGLRGSQELGMREVVGLYNEQKPTQRVKGNEETR